MPTIVHINLEGDGIWPDMAGKEIIEVNEISLSALTAGMESGRPSIAMKIDLPDGRVVLAQTSMRNFLVAAGAFAIRYGAEF